MNLTRIVENLIRPPQQGHAEGPDNSVAEPGGSGPGAVPIGTLKTLGGYVYQWDGRRWYNTGVRDEAAPKAQEAPQIEYDAQGRAFRWTTLNGQPVTAFLGAQFDRPDKAAGYRAPSAPRYPTTEVNNQTGDIFQSDGYGGLPVWVGNDPRLITDFTPGQTRANTLSDLEASRRFTSGESEASRRFTAGENAASRAASREESDLSRALNAGQFAATLQAQRQRDEMAAEESYQNRMRQYGQDKIAGARTVAELTNSVDPTALPAFYRAGGGNIENAIQAGASAVSDRAVLPAAQALRGTREMATPSRFTFAPLNVPSVPTPATNAGPPEKVMTNDEVAAELRRQLQPKAVPSGLGSTAPASQADYGAHTGGGFSNVSPDQYALIPEQFKRYAFGTQGEPATTVDAGMLLDFLKNNPGNPDLIRQANEMLQYAQNQQARPVAVEAPSPRPGASSSGGWQGETWAGGSDGVRSVPPSASLPDGYYNDGGANDPHNRLAQPVSTSGYDPRGLSPRGLSDTTESPSGVPQGYYNDGGPSDPHRNLAPYSAPDPHSGLAQTYGTPWQPGDGALNDGGANDPHRSLGEVIAEVTKLSQSSQPDSVERALADTDSPLFNAIFRLKRSGRPRPRTPAGWWGPQTPRYAFGTPGEPATGTFMTGDSTNPDDPFAGGARPELNTVEDPPGPNNARVHVQPLAPPEEGGEMSKFGAVLRAIGAMLTGNAETPAGPPRYALGTGTYDPYAPIQPGDQPYLDEIRNIRTTAEYPELNPYATKYRFEAPTVRSSFLMGRQGRYGVPVIDQQAQIDRYQVPTASRSGFSLGV